MSPRDRTEYARLVVALLTALVPAAIAQLAMPAMHDALASIPVELPALTALTLRFHALAALLPLPVLGIWLAEPAGRLRGMVAVWVAIALALLTPPFLGLVLYLPVWQMGHA